MNTSIFWKLIANDLRVYKKNNIAMAFYILAIMMFSIINTQENMAGGIVSIGMMLCVISTATFLIEVKTNPLIFTASLPISRTKIFTARLVSIVVLFLLNLLLWIIAVETLQLFSIVPDQAVFSLKTISMLLVIAFFHWSIFYIVYYRFNFLITALLYLCSLFIPVFMVIKFWRTKSSMVPEFVEGDLKLIGLPFLIVLGIFVFSLTISLKHFERKDI